MSTTTVPNDSCLSPQLMGPEKKPPHKRRESAVNLQPIQQLWTACSCKKICDSLRVGSVWFIGPFVDRVSSGLYDLVADEPRCSSLPSWSLACMLSRVYFYTENACQELCRSFGPIRGCSHFLSQTTQKKQATRLAPDDQRQRATVHSGSPLPVVLFLVLSVMAYRNRQSRTLRVTEFFSL